jgi:type IV secretion system protein VirD4
MSFLHTIGSMLKTTPKDLIQVLLASPVTEARYCVSSLAGMEERVVASIMSEISKNVVHFVTDKALISALSRKKNITPEDLEYGFDIYINIPEHLLRQWKNLLTLIVNQFLTHFEQRDETNAHPILFLLDEFPRLGKVSAMLDGLATLRSKKISICLIIQSLAQLDTIYGYNERKVIADTCAYKAILGATDADTQEYFSRLVGTYNRPMTSYGTQSEAYTGLPKSTSATTYQHERRIIKPEDFGLLRDIVLLTPYGFYRVDKMPYYLD